MFRAQVGSQAGVALILTLQGGALIVPVGVVLVSDLRGAEGFNPRDDRRFDHGVAMGSGDIEDSSHVDVLMRSRDVVRDMMGDHFVEFADCARRAEAKFSGEPMVSDALYECGHVYFRAIQPMVREVMLHEAGYGASASVASNLEIGKVIVEGTSSSPEGYKTLLELPVTRLPALLLGKLGRKDKVVCKLEDIFPQMPSNDGAQKGQGL
ncbi:hypothetical protein ACLOJK_007512 [Asimina triloba]